MEPILKSDVFFFITGIAVILLAIVGLVALFYLIKIFRDIKHIAKTARKEADNLVKDFEYYRKDLKNGEKEIKSFAKTVNKIVK